MGQVLQETLLAPYAARFWFFPNRALALPVAEALQNFRPAIHAIRVRHAQRDSFPRRLRSDGCPIALLRDHIRARHEPFQI